jgi:hypothetical protein
MAENRHAVGGAPSARGSVAEQNWPIALGNGWFMVARSAPGGGPGPGCCERLPARQDNRRVRLRECTALSASWPGTGLWPDCRVCHFAVREAAGRRPVLQGLGGVLQHQIQVLHCSA